MKAQTYLTGTNQALLAVADWEGVPDTVTVLPNGCILCRYRWDDAEKLAVAMFDDLAEFARVHVARGQSPGIFRMFVFASERFTSEVSLDDVLDAIRALDVDQPVPPRWNETLHDMIDRDLAVTDERLTLTTICAGGPSPALTVGTVTGDDVLEAATARLLETSRWKVGES